MDGVIMSVDTFRHRRLGSDGLDASEMERLVSGVQAEKKMMMMERRR